MSTALNERPTTDAEFSEHSLYDDSTSVRSTQVSEKAELTVAYLPDRLQWKNLDWPVVVWMAAIHVGALAAPFFFTWQAAAVTVVLYWLTASPGICLGFHRYLSHRSMKLKAPADFFVVLCGVLSGQGSPLTWVATHRLHHQKSDHEGDPHSPLDGKWWSHIMWLFVRQSPETRQKLYQRYTPELVDRKLLQFFDRTYGLWMIGSAVVLYALGGWPMLLWGLCVRMVIAYHSTWFVNSATHLWGYRNYQTRDQSRNLWWVAVLAFGEGWHNNHHAHPSVAPAGHRWWEIDTTWWVIKALRFCGQATNVNDNIPAPAAEPEPEQEILAA